MRFFDQNIITNYQSFARCAYVVEGGERRLLGGPALMTTVHLAASAGRADLEEEHEGREVPPRDDDACNE